MLAITTVNFENINEKYLLQLKGRHYKKRKVHGLLVDWNDTSDKSYQIGPCVSIIHDVRSGKKNYFLRVCFAVNEISNQLNLSPSKIIEAYKNDTLKELLENGDDEEIESIPSLEQASPSPSPKQQEMQAIRFLESTYEKHLLDYTRFANIVNFYRKIKSFISEKICYLTPKETKLSHTFVFLPHEQQQGLHILLARQVDVGTYCSLQLSFHVDKARFTVLRSSNSANISITERQINECLADEPDHFLAGRYFDFNNPSCPTQQAGAILPYADKGNLLNLFQQHYPEPIPFAFAAYLAYQIAYKLSILHDYHEIVHLDLKPENILLDSENNVYLCDFGTSNFIHQPIKYHGATFRYLDPSRFSEEEPKAKPEQDMWSFGLILANFILTDQWDNWTKQYKGKFSRLFDMPEAEFENAKDQFFPERKVQGSFHWVIDQCLQRDPSKRPSAAKMMRALYHIYNDLRDR